MNIKVKICIVVLASFDFRIISDSDCELGKFGLECEKTCNCATDEACFVATGGCPSGCKAGYYGEACDKACHETFYGSNCSQRCSPNCTDSLCHPANGHCLSCIAGRQGSFCDQPCDVHHYGVGCVSSCPLTCLDSICDSTTGFCTRCNPCYTGELCQSELHCCDGRAECIGIGIGVGVVLTTIVVLIITAILHRSKMLIIGRNLGPCQIREETVSTGKQQTGLNPRVDSIVNVFQNLKMCLLILIDLFPVTVLVIAILLVCLQPPKQPISLLLVGKTGSGKSTTGNTILRKKVFKTGASCTSVTKTSESSFSAYQGTKITVVDTPGFMDTEMDNETLADILLQSINESPTGFDAFLYVVPYGVRFTDEEKKAIENFKETFGQDVIKKMSIIVVTRGDQYSPEETGTNDFQDWCNKQEGGFKDLIDESGGRVLLFNNKLTDIDQNDQIEKLIEMVTKIKGHYSQTDFAKAKDRIEIRRKITADLYYIIALYKSDKTIEMLEVVQHKVHVLLNYANTKIRLYPTLKPIADPLQPLAESVKRELDGKRRQEEEARRSAENRNRELSRETAVTASGPSFLEFLIGAVVFIGSFFLFF